MRRSTGSGVLVAALFAFGFAFLGPKTLSAQCPNCLDDPELYEHKMTLFIVFFGWHPEPGPWHLDSRPGICMYNHTAGCWNLDEEEEQDVFELAAHLSTLEGEALRQSVEGNSELLEVEVQERFVGVRTCSGAVALWVSLTPGQAFELKQETETASDPKLNRFAFNDHFFSS